MKKALNNAKKQKTTLILGDFNAKVGSVLEDGVAGNYRRSMRNERENA